MPATRTCGSRLSISGLAVAEQSGIIEDLSPKLLELAQDAERRCHRGGDVEVDGDQLLGGERLEFRENSLVGLLDESFVMDGTW
jgi:hypothetical protein